MSTAKLILRNKCLVLGNATVGKTALVQTFHSDGTQFPKTYNMTIHAEVCVKPINIPDTNCKSASSYILVYDVTNQDSFKSLTKWLQIIKQIKDLRSSPSTSSGGSSSTSSSRGVLVACKVDQGFRRAVSTSEGEEFAKANHLAYFECSAAAHTDVEAPFYYVANAFHESFEEHQRNVIKAASEIH
eukprot:jgi/Hompol1/271/HPOL_000972-RA